MYGCHPDATPSLNQAFILTTDGQLRTVWDICIDAPGDILRLMQCSATNVRWGASP